MSGKPCSSNSEHSHSADSTSASAVALPYLASSRLSSEPALTPIRIGTPAAAAARAISPTLSSNALMLPGLTRTAAQPASIAANTYLGWKWMSAITGICDLRAISRQRVGVVLRRDGDPDDLAARRGELGDLLQGGVDVGRQRGGHRLHGDRRAAADRHRVRAVAHDDLAGQPARCERLRRQLRQCLGQQSSVWLTRLTGRMMDRVDDIRHDQEQAESDQQREDTDAHRDQLPHVDQAGVGLAAQPGQPGPARS